MVRGPTLAYDQSLPRVRERFTPHIAPADRALAQTRLREASALLGRAGRADGAGDVAALGDLLAVTAAYSPDLVRDRVRAAAAASSRPPPLPAPARWKAGPAPTGGPPPARGNTPPRAARGGGAAVVLTLLTALVEAVEAAAAWHRAQEFCAQPRAAADAAVLLARRGGPDRQPALRPARPGADASRPLFPTPQCVYRAVRRKMVAWLW
ncbi:hypothetical protein ADK96_04905 [Streptomyces sp. IGB124]|nr:hypothetical protein ADK96_04905 [Streptomyces sp. IGB124]